MTFLAGGFQDARGSNDAGEFYVENVIEELDVASEWYYDEVTHILHFAYNGTGAPPTDGSIVAIAGHAITIVNITAPMAAPWNQTEARARRSPIALRSAAKRSACAAPRPS